MGNMPNRLVGRAAALVLALLVAGAAYLGGRWAGDQLAYGFTFDWYVHEVSSAYEVGHVLFWSAVAAAAAAVVAVGVIAPLTGILTRVWARRVRYAAPRAADPDGLDSHTVRLGAALPTLSALLTLLGFYALLALPMLSTDAAGVRGTPIDRISPGGFSLLVGTAAALGALLATYFAAALTFEGVVSGRLREDVERNVIGTISLFGARNARATVALVLILTMVAGAYASTVTTNVDVADVLPRGDPNTAAAKNLTSTFKSSFTQQVTFQFRVLDVNNSSQMDLFVRENEEKLPNRADVGSVPHIVEGIRAGQPPERGEPNPNNITDELYIRAMAQAIDFFLAQEPFAGSVAGADYYALINWTIEGGESADPGSFSIPDTSPEGEARYQMVKAGVENVGAVYNALDAVSSPTWRQTAVLILVDPKDDVTTKEIGQRALEVRDAYVEAVRKNPGSMYQVFGPDNPPQFSVDLPIANAHASELTQHDFKLLLPIIGVFIAITLFIAFRNAASVTVTFSMLVIAVVWTFGAMGFLKIPLNTLNLAVVPLIMGIGIDYGIHMMNEYQEFRARGYTPDESWVKAGGGSAFALLVGMLTTVAGLLVMIISPSLLVAQVGILGIVAMLSCYTLAILFLPAMVTVLGERKKTQRHEFTPSRIMPLLATGLSRTRVLVVLVMLLLAGSAYASQTNLTREAFGDPPRNWLPDDPLRQEHERAIQGFYDTPTDDVKANVIIIEGDLTDPAVHDYINGITGTLRAYATTGFPDPANGNQTRESRIIADTLKDLPFLVNTWLTVRGGVPGAGQFLGAGALEPLFERMPPEAGSGLAPGYPRTQEEMTDTLESMFRSPIYQFGYLFADAPDFKMTVIVFSARAATYEDAEQVWTEVQAAIAANDALRPEGVQTSFFGNTAINYLFVAKQVPWLNAMSIVSTIVVVSIVALATRRIRPTLTVGIVSGLTTLLWYGLLPQVGIGLAISLTLPVIFIAAMGSDYALHLAMRCEKTRDTRHTFESVGKGVLFSFVTTIGAFLIFTRISDLAGRRSIVGTVLAIAVVFAVALLTVPVIYPVKKVKRRGAPKAEPGRSVPVSESPPAVAASGAPTPPPALPGPAATPREPPATRAKETGGAG
jgi:predicted RND superfamily exporter protein